MWVKSSNREVKSGKWRREANRGLEIKGKTIGIIGYGNMGSSFARKISGFEANVVILTTGSPFAKTAGTNAAAVNVTLGVYPNPFSEFTNFTFDLDEATDVELVIYDLSGKVIRTLADREFESGTNQVRWDGNNNFGAPVAVGVYFYRLEAGEFVKTNRIIVTR